MLNPRKRLLRRLRDLMATLAVVLMPNPTDGFRIGRYKLVLLGWIWYVFPRFGFELIEHIDVRGEVNGAIASVRAYGEKFADEVRGDAKATVQNTVEARTKALRRKLDDRVTQAVVGRDNIAAAVTADGRAAVTTMQRAIVDAAGATATATYVEAARSAVAQFMDYARQEAGGAPKNPPALPVGTRFVHYGDPWALYFVEEPPRTRTVYWNQRPITVSLPYVVFVLTLRYEKFYSVQAYFRCEPLKSLDDALCRPCLPDLGDMRYDDADLTKSIGISRVCWPYGLGFYGSTPAELAHEVSEKFWNSGFRIEHWGPKHLPSGFTHEAWVSLSQTDPLHVLQVPWVPTGATPASIIDGVRPKKAPDIKTTLSRLERYAIDLGERLGVAIREAVLEKIAEESGPAAARKAFDASLRRAMTDASIGENLERALRDDLTNAYNEAGADAALDEVARRTADRLNALVTATADGIAVRVATAITGNTVNTTGATK